MKTLAGTIALAVALAVTSAPSAAGTDHVAVFAVQWWSWALHGQGDPMYETLVPQQQKMISRLIFDQCALQTKIPASIIITRWKVVSEKTSTVLIPGTKAKTRATTVTLKLHTSDGRDSPIVSLRVVTSRHGLRWMTFLASAYHAGSCG